MLSGIEYVDLVIYLYIVSFVLVNYIVLLTSFVDPSKLKLKNVTESK